MTGARGASGTYVPTKRRAVHLRLRYGLTEEGYQLLYELQEGCCAICGESQPVLHIDHDHDTDIIRGLLCYGCNNGLGAFKDDAQRLVAAANYLMKGPAPVEQIPKEERKKKSGFEKGRKLGPEGALKSWETRRKNQAK